MKFPNSRLASALGERHWSPVTAAKGSRGPSVS